MIRRLLGCGGMGEVYLAEDPRLRREVAVKVLPAAFSDDPDRLARFRREARAAAALSHPNICTIFDVGEAEGRPYIVMEYVRGRTLRERIQGGELPVEEIVDVASQIASALEEAWQKDVIHRDIKSRNILVTESGQVKVLDFGLAKQLSPAKRGLPEEHPTSTVSGFAPGEELSPDQRIFDEGSLTGSGAVLGTVSYMSPEQALGKRVDHRSDLFSVGVVLYEMIAGRLPFAGATPAQVFDAILHTDPPPITRDVPSGLRVIVGRLLEKDPARRYQTAGEAARDLDALREGRSVRRFTSPRPALRSRWLIGAAAGLLAAALVLIASTIEWIQPRRPAAAPPASVLALPARVFGPAEFGFYADAVPSTLTTHLVGVAGLETKVPPTSFEVERVKGDLERIASAYAVEAFVLSTATIRGDGLVLNVQLVEARTRRLLWSQEFEGRTGAYLELARYAAAGVRKALRPGAAPVALAAQPSSSEAELAFLRGQHYSNRYNNRQQRVDFDIALASFKRALELEPRRAEVMAETGSLILKQMEVGGPTDAIFSEAEAWARRALAIDPRSPAAWLILARLEANVPGRADMRKRLEYALKANAYGPRYAVSYQAVNHAVGASFELGLAAIAEGRRVDPLYLYPALGLASQAYYLGRPTEALPLLDEVLRDEPEMAWALWRKSITLADLGRLDDAEQLVRQVQDRSQRGEFPEPLTVIARHALAVRQRNAAEAARLLLRVRSFPADRRISMHDIGFVALDSVPFLARAGDSAMALQLLEACRRRGFVPPYDWLLVNPQLEPLRKDAHFEKIAVDARRRLDETFEGLDEAKARGELPAYLERAARELKAKLGWRKT